MRKLLKRWGVALLAAGLSIALAQAEDIDVFVGNANVDVGLPNVIFVLDNTSNWSRQSQGWPGGITQGQSEVRALKTALAGLVGQVNVGLVEFTTQGNAGQDGGYVRFNLQKLTEQSQRQLSNILVDGEKSIFKEYDTPIEKRNSNTPYGNLMYDVYNYLAGRSPTFNGLGTPTLADGEAYDTKYSQFRSPLTSDSLCADTYLIFIGNPNSNGPTEDSSENSTALRALYAAVEGDSDALARSTGGMPLPIPLFTTTTTTEPGTLLGYSSQCYKDSDVEACTTDVSAAGGLCYGKDNCYCSVQHKSTNTTGCVTTGNNKTSRLGVLQGGGTTTVVAPTGDSNNSIGRAWNFDDWAKFFHNHGVPVSHIVEGEQVTQRVKIKTYTIDVFNKQQNADHTGLMLSGANVGGGRYFAARNEDSIVEAINEALSDILSVSSTFAAVTLPLSATNRAQQENQVFIGMFRPDREAKPRWFGNLKRYQITLFNGYPELADAKRAQAINPLSGFAAECAESFWTSDSGAYWENLGIDPAPSSKCANLPADRSQWSDLPDGPFVEKGGVAQKLRESTLTSRNMLTVGNGNLTALTSDSHAAALGGAEVFDYLRGTRVGIGEVAPAAGGRPAIHGDVIHSRPLTINYGGSAGIYVYYGANDGLFRSIRAADGEEQWSLIAPEHFSRIKRLYNNEPYVSFPNTPPPKGKTAEAKGYFFDGGIGQLVRYDEENRVDLAYIYPTMRRGGRMVYGFDVTSPTSPDLLWRVGCPAGSTCMEGFENIGQTWSTPLAGYLRGYTELNTTDLRPVVMFGGGYDTCLDADQAAYPCSSTARGRGVYVLDAKSGALLRKLETDAPVVAELATVDINYDNSIDFAYAADAAGNLYRIDFARMATDGTLTALSKEQWEITKVAATSDTTRRFLNAPSVAVFQDRVYVALGSGNRERPLETNYPFAQSVQDRFYVFVDFPGVDSEAAVDLDGSQLLDVTAAAPGADVDCSAQGARGWFMNLQGRGEQVVNPAAIAGGQVLFNSYRPGTPTTGMCSRPLGIATAYRMSLFSPSACDLDRSSEIVGGGMPIPPVLATVPVTDPDGGNGKLVTVCIGCEGLKVDEIIPDTDQVRRRVYWSTDIDR